MRASRIPAALILLVLTVFFILPAVWLLLAPTKTADQLIHSNPLAFGSFDGHIYAIDRNCNKILDENVEDSVWSSPALYDIDGDGRKEIFIGGDQDAGLDEAAALAVV